MRTKVHPKTLAWAKKAEKVAKKAVKEAISGHLAAGNPVYVSKNRQIIRINPDGSRTKLSK